IGSETSVLSPTLFDIQVNGAKGINLQTADVRPEDVRAVTDVLAAWGVSHWIPTLVTGSLDTMERACRVVVEAMRDPVVARAVPGLHCEGPCISPVDGPRGAHPRQYVRDPKLSEFDRLLDAANGHIVYTTLAPELPGAIPYIKGLVRRGVVVSLGHHQATAEQIARAVDAGAAMCTHLGNGLASTIHRHVNPLWPQLADDRLAASLIPDLHHLPPAMLKSLARAKGPDRAIFTSDAVHMTLLKPGAYELAGAKVELKPSGRICLSGTDLLAGSSLMLLQGVVNAVREADLTWKQTVACASTIPARVLGLPYRFNPPKVGKKADLVVFDVNKHGKAAVQCVFIDGKRVK
ncbi:MAG: Amidohydrolase family protein, partial [Candidatus Hydrogenedentes bacterium]|nr:Amidohydrolase family protein [Candidatus Hydrogenedentota bacterium]